MGYAERDAERGDDSWKSFHEVMCLAKEKDVDMVLLAGDLFHDNKPSRKSMYNVMRSLRMNCYGDKPCELEMLSDGSDVFQGYVVGPTSAREENSLSMALGLSLIMPITKTQISMWLSPFFQFTAITMIRQGCVDCMRRGGINLTHIC